MKRLLLICFLLLVLIPQANAVPGCCLNPERGACKVMDSDDCCKDSKCIDTQFFMSNEEYACAILPTEKADLCRQGCCCKYLSTTEETFVEAYQAKKVDCTGEALLWTSDFSGCDEEFCLSLFGAKEGSGVGASEPKGGGGSGGANSQTQSSITISTTILQGTTIPPGGESQAPGSKCDNLGGNCERGLFRGGLLAFVGLISWCDKGETRISEAKDCGWLRSCCKVEAVTPQDICIDGTPSGHCSQSKPSLCLNKKLRDDCQKCGCPTGYECNKDGSCSQNQATVLQYSGDPNTKLDIVLVSSNYLSSDMSLFKGDAGYIMDGLLGIEPFKSERNKINIYRLDNIDDLGCQYNCNNVERLICCDFEKIEQVVATTPHDQVVVVVNGPYGGSAGTYAIAYRGDFRATAHELGHSFGKLLDEYSYGDYGTDEDPYGPNCDRDSTCSLWSDLIGTDGVGCYPTCLHENWYRPILEDSIMLDLGGDYNPVGTRKLIQEMERYS